ncbi:DUF4172 domain-containing protein [Flavobacterium sp. TAB 87]|uniref:DUF4172 domain-containing protein n=1 Tax=Flavobacterium sp. TAB 87 TaxID=1729581 RepID=UPI00076CED8F|nr:hypothetical protein AP058_00278 [Flavobacterium sp. TAB 87]
MYIHQNKDWPNSNWDADVITPLVGKVRHQQGIILGVMQGHLEIIHSIPSIGDHS